MEIINGRIADIKPDGGLVIHAVLPSIERACVRQYATVTIGLHDGRAISPEQRRKAYALMGEIAEWSGHTLEQIKLTAKAQYIGQHMQALEKRMFSLSDCDMTTAREFISYLIEFILSFDVPTHVPLYQLCEDLKHYVFHCLTHKKCCVCGKPAELHHVDRVGMGRNRDTIFQLGMPVISLCRGHHRDVDDRGSGWLHQDLHLEPIPLTAEIGKVYHLTRKNLSGYARREAHHE